MIGNNIKCMGRTEVGWGQLRIEARDGKYFFRLRIKLFTKPKVVIVITLCVLKTLGWRSIFGIMELYMFYELQNNAYSYGYDQDI